MDCSPEDVTKVKHVLMLAPGQLPYISAGQRKEMLRVFDSLEAQAISLKRQVDQERYLRSVSDENVLKLKGYIKELEKKLDIDQQVEALAPQFGNVSVSGNSGLPSSVPVSPNKDPSFEIVVTPTKSISQDPNADSPSRFAMSSGAKPILSFPLPTKDLQDCLETIESYQTSDSIRGWCGQVVQFVHDTQNILPVLHLRDNCDIEANYLDVGIFLLLTPTGVLLSYHMLFQDFYAAESLRDDGEVQMDLFAWLMATCRYPAKRFAGDPGVHYHPPTWRFPEHPQIESDPNTNMVNEH